MVCYSSRFAPSPFLRPESQWRRGPFSPLYGCFDTRKNLRATKHESCRCGNPLQTPSATANSQVVPQLLNGDNFYRITIFSVVKVFPYPAMTLPIAAGLSYVDQLLRPEAHKSQQCFFANGGVPYVVPKESRGMKTEISPGGYIDQTGESAFPNVGHRTPWSNTPNVTLQFGSYVYEDYVHGRLDEKTPVRFFQIYFHMEDDTVRIQEQMLDSSNIYEGKFLHRQRVPKHDNPAKHLTIYDFNVGKPVIIFGRQHMVYKCDLFTRKTLTGMGFEIADDLSPPISQAAATIDVNKNRVETLKRHINTDNQFSQFLKHDGDVLRFYAIFDDRDSMYGDKHFLVMHYYLADDTMEILRKTPQANGRDKMAPYVKRCKIPKKTGDLGNMAPGSPWPVLKTMPNSKQPVKGYYLFDQAQLPDVAEALTDKDLITGISVTVFGRQIFIYDCDDFTRWHYKTQYGKDMHKFDVREEEKPKPARVIPPHNGYGREEDSVQNCHRLLPKSPLLDARKYLSVDCDSDDPPWLTFRLKLLTENPQEAQPAFVMTYHLNDHGIFVSCADGGRYGKFLEKKCVKKGSNQSSTLPEYLQPNDLYVGSVIQLRQQCYVITDADESTLKFMEKYPQKFPFANITTVFNKFKDVVRCKQDICAMMCNGLCSNDPGSGLVRHEVFLKIIMDAAGNAVTPHEYTTILRAYQHHPYTDLQRRRQLLRAYIQHCLRQDLWEPQYKLLSAYQKADVYSRGNLSREDMIRIAKATRIPVRGPAFEMYLEIVPDEGDVDYKRVVQELDWVHHSAQERRDLPNIIDANFNFDDYFGTGKIKMVRYQSFLKDLGCEDALTKTDHNLLQRALNTTAPSA